MSSCIALIRKDPTSDYSIDFPDFPGCITAASTLDEARALAAEALGFHIDGMLEDGDAIPLPACLTDVMADLHHSDAVAVLVDVPGRLPRPVRVNITLPEDLLREIDRTTTNRSRFLAEAAQAKLKAA